MVQHNSRIAGLASILLKHGPPCLRENLHVRVLVHLLENIRIIAGHETFLSAFFTDLYWIFNPIV